MQQLWIICCIYYGFAENLWCDKISIAVFLKVCYNNLNSNLNRINEDNKQITVYKEDIPCYTI